MKLNEAQKRYIIVAAVMAEDDPLFSENLSLAAFKRLKVALKNNACANIEGIFTLDKKQEIEHAADIQGTIEYASEVGIKH